LRGSLFGGSHGVKTDLKFTENDSP
jgi:hypothetical protein